MTQQIHPSFAGYADRLEGRFALWAGSLAGPIDAGMALLAQDGVLAALYDRRPEVWSDDPQVQARIGNRLGWLVSPDGMLPHLERLRQFASGVRSDGFTDVVLLGMGGSSLAPEVLRAVVGTREGWMTLRMLDSTDPASVAAVRSSVDLARTLFLLASKSGGTVEPNSMAAFFRQELTDAGLAWARHFVAVTDEGTALHRRAVAEGFRDVFLNPADIGGRYSALSFFGLVPAALMGLDIEAVVNWGRAMLWVCGPDRPLASNPAALLGVAMGVGARAGRDKLTLISDPALEAFGLWAEQLVAESTGKAGVGVVPVAGEALAPRGAYGTDRVLVQLSLGNAAQSAHRDPLRDHAADGHPFVQIELAEPEALGAEFVRWELATAIAGRVLGVNPFDEPNVQQAKDATGHLLSSYAAAGHLPRPDVTGSVAGLDAMVSQAAQAGLDGSAASRFLSLIGPGDYFGLLAYLGPDPALLDPLITLRQAVRDRLGVATTFGYGPRYLHSTGQLHKGGANIGVFLIVSATPRHDVAVPGAGYSFGTLELAQALGDFASLEAAGRRALHVHLPEPDPLWLQRLSTALLGDLHNAPGA